MPYDGAVTKKGVGGKPAWPERPGDPRTTWLVNLYVSQKEWLTSRPEGGAAWLRAKIDEAMGELARSRRVRKPKRPGKGKR